MKQINKENLLERDLPDAFSNLSQDTWIQSLLRPKISHQVPEDISTLFEVVRGSMIYGWFFYPLGTLASEQCFRILELAVSKRCEQLGVLSDKRAAFFERIENLKKCGAINLADNERWDGIRNLRNEVSHPKKQILLLPGQTTSIFYITVELINKLFEGQVSKA